MNEMDITKGVYALENIATNLNRILDYINNNKINGLLTYTDKIHKECIILTDIFEKAFIETIAEKERMEDDGK